MEYYLIEISRGKIAEEKQKDEILSMTHYTDKDEAIGNYYQHIGNAMKSDLYTYHQAIVINSAGGIEAEPHVFERKMNSKPAAQVTE